LNLKTWGWQQQVIAVSGDVADSVTRHAGARVPVKVILNGINVEHFSRLRADAAPVRRAFDIPSDAPIVGTVAVFRVQKNLPDWLEAARRLRERYSGMHFLIVGDGPLREQLVGHARELGLQDVVHFAGLQNDVRPYLAAMDLYMMSSVFEGLPVALLEAMAMECPIVSTAVGGVPEVVRDGYNGLLVPPRDPAQLARVAGDALVCPAELRKYGELARRTVEARFSMQRMSRELEATYVDVVGRYRNAQ
jgi:glycosyltransferase involved in cell wall biosynthesis